jgi:nitrite reductase (cytochrome c-552)
MWAGYAFSVDFRKKRGHAYMLEDQTYTQRVQQFSQPGTCLHCHASVYVPYKQAGGGDLIKGFEVFNHMPYQERGRKVEHPIACIDCHDPKTMQLRVTRPGFLEGIRALKASQGIENYDPNTMATRQEMRTYVCGQCHVEYYFKGPEKRLTYPWAKGINIDQIADYYDEVGFADWTHAETGTPQLKAQHPRVRDVQPGDPRTLGRRVRRLSHAVHAGRRAQDQRPPRPQPALEHQPRVPAVPQVAGRRVEGSRRNDPGPDVQAAESRDGRIDGSDRRSPSLTRSGASDAELANARKAQRRGQFYLDFVESENSNGFHAPEEAARILGDAIDYFRQGQVSLRVLKKMK